MEWGSERLVVVEDETAGMVWAPDAIWDPEEGAYLIDHDKSQLLAFYISI